MSQLGPKITETFASSGGQRHTKDNAPGKVKG